MIRKLEGVLDDMCSVIEYYERKARLNATLKDIEKIEKKMNMSLEEAIDIVEIVEELKNTLYVRLGDELE